MKNYIYYGCCDKICNNTKYLISDKSGITDINYNFPRSRIDSYNSLPIEKTLTFYNIVILTKSVANKNKNEYYFNIFLEKGSYKNNLISWPNIFTPPHIRILKEKIVGQIFQF